MNTPSPRDVPGGSRLIRSRAVEHLVRTTIENYGYLAVFVLMVLESACIPIPSEVTMLFGGAAANATFAASVGADHLNFLVVGLLGTLGNRGEVLPADQHRHRGHPGGRHRLVAGTAGQGQAPGGRRRAGMNRPPGPRVGLARGFLFYRRDPLAFLMETASRYGDVAYFRAGPFDVYLLSHPDLIREVAVTHHHQVMKSQGLQEAKRILGEGLLTSEGDVHRRQRRLIQPLFHHQRIDGYGAAMVEFGERFSERWR